MQNAQIADCVIAILFLLSVLTGYHRGLIKTIAGIVAMVVSYVGAVFIATVGKDILSEQLILPMITKRLTDSPFAALAGDVLEKTASGLSYSLLFGIAFFLLHFILFRVVRSLKVINDIPVVGFYNKLGGAILGFLWVFLICVFLGQVFFTYVPKDLRREWGFGKKAVQQTVLLEAFRPEKK